MTWEAGGPDSALESMMINEEEGSMLSLGIEWQQIQMWDSAEARSLDARFQDHGQIVRTRNCSSISSAPLQKTDERSYGVMCLAPFSSVKLLFISPTVTITPRAGSLLCL